MRTRVSREWIKKRREELRLKRLPTGHSEFTTPNGVWAVRAYERTSHVFGVLTSTKTGNRYVFSVREGRVTYMREYKPPTTIPRYIDNILLSLQEK